MERTYSGREPSRLGQDPKEGGGCHLPIGSSARHDAAMSADNSTASTRLSPHRDKALATCRPANTDLHRSRWPMLRLVSKPAVIRVAVLPARTARGGTVWLRGENHKPGNGTERTAP